MPEAESRLTKNYLPGPAGTEPALGYLLYLPPGYAGQPEKNWPVVFFLHGAGERGSDLDKVKVHGLPREISQGQDYPFIVVAPQCPLDQRWIFKLKELDELYAQIMSNYRVLPGQVYLTGMSMGGQGTWFWTLAHPERFAAIAPICGRSFPEQAEKIKALPIWVFHGAKDPIVLLEESTVMVEALKIIGSDIRFTIYPEAEHDSWSITYTNPELYEWFLSHSR
jgi:predicted peptidase